MSSASIIILKNNENVTFVMNPSITYFKSVYRKHTKFTISYKEEQPIGNDNFKDSNQSINIDLNYYADLLCDISLKVSVDDNVGFSTELTGNPNSGQWPNDISLFLINDITLNMSGPNVEMDKLDKEYINFHYMLNNPKSNNSTYSLIDGKLTCNDGNNFQNMALCGGVINNNNSSGILKEMTSVIPLPFAFSKSIGNSIPLCSLNTTNTKPRIVISRTDITQSKYKFIKDNSREGNIRNNEIMGLFKYSIISKYIFLSTEEKLRFRNSKQEYLYERVNILNQGEEFNDINLKNRILQIDKLSTNHPIKQIYLYNNIDTSNNIKFNNLKYNLSINHQQTFSESLNHEFFSKVEILNKFKGCIYNGIKNGNTLINNNIAIIDFSLKNSDGPSGCISPKSNSININIDPGVGSSDLKFGIKVYVVCYYFLTISNETISFMFE